MDPGKLIVVQRLDTSIDQARHALARLPELENEEVMSQRLAVVRGRIGDLSREKDAFESEMSVIEKRDGEIAVHLARLDRQMKTVIAPREAEALQHEMQNLGRERESGDERGLEILDAVSGLIDSLDEARRDEVAAASSLAAASTEARRAESEARAAIVELETHRDTAASSIDPEDLANYERRRRLHDGVAITTIDHGVCGGCHMDISPSEMDAIKRLPADRIAECPNCTRLLVR